MNKKPENGTGEVVVPGGPRDRHLVQAVSPGEVVRFGGPSRMAAASRAIRSRAAIPKDFVATPGGPRHKSLAHKVEPGHVLLGDGNLRILHLQSKQVVDIPKLPHDELHAPALGSGWIAYAYWNNGSGSSISRFATRWTVPAAPRTSSGQTIFLFNGIENYGTNFGILQPVLQWGPSAAGGGAFWAVANWYVAANGNAFYSNLVRVNTGDILDGVMALTGTNVVIGQPTTFNYTSEFTNVANTSLAVANIAELLWCNHTLEAYAVQKCTDYPNADSTAFTSIDIQTGTTRPTLNWTATNPINDCGQYSTVVSNSSTTGEVAIYYCRFPTSLFTAVYAQGDPGGGIGGYDLASPADRAFAFDYDHSGKLDHLALYRPGTGTIWILKNNAGNFSAVYAEGDPGGGIGGFDLASPRDRAFAFDYDHSGKLDHIVLYRPGTGTMWILKNDGGNFSAVYAQGDPGGGIGGYDLASPADRAFAFDYDRSGKLDHIVLYRPGTGTMWILKNDGGNFSAVYAQGDPGGGIGGYDLASPRDRASAFDYEGSGRQDYLAMRRPGTGTIWILKNSGGAFSPVYAQGDPGGGIGGYDLASSADRLFSFDFDSSGRRDHLTLYRPGTGTMWVLGTSAGGFSPVYAQGDPGRGIGGYDLASAADRAFAFDYASSGKADHIALIRPGTGTIWILRRA